MTGALSTHGHDRHRSPILVLAFDPLTERMPGPAIRAWHLAEVLAAEHPVTLAGTAGVTRKHPLMTVVPADGAELRRTAEGAMMIVAPSSAVFRYPYLADLDVPLVLDYYVPSQLENLEPSGSIPGPPVSADDVAVVARQVLILNTGLDRGDFFLCASERQRDFWLGSLAARGRVNPINYREDPQLRGLIDVVPFGLPATAPARSGPGLRQRIPGIGPDDPVIIWGGGVYPWFDPVSLVRAIDRVRGSIADVRLVFLGMRNPTPGLPEMGVAAEVRRVSEDLGLTGTNVFFNEGWVPYDERADFLLDADLAVSTHLDHLETRFSFRTRILDYLWAGLPMVLTEGDTLTEQVVAADLGISVPPENPAAIAAAIVRLLGERQHRSPDPEFLGRFSWPSVASPLVEFSRHPHRAADAARVAASEPEPEPEAESLLEPPDQGAESIGGRIRRRLARP